MRNFVVSSLLFVCFLVSSCVDLGRKVRGNGNIETENREISNANKIRVAGPMNVIIDSGETALRIEAESNVLAHIITERDNDWLDIKTRDKVSLSTTQPVTVYITTPQVEAIRIAGSGNVNTAKKMWLNSVITIDISGSGDVKMAVNSPRVDANIAGSGTAIISGETKDVNISIAGSGNFEGRELKAENASIKIAGSGDAIVFADVTLSAKIFGSGNVSYVGDAKVEKTIAGSGVIKRIE